MKSVAASECLREVENRENEWRCLPHRSQAKTGTLARGTPKTVIANDNGGETNACGLGIAAPLVTDSLLRYFPERVAAFVGR
ncbi:MAG: hypothetical protein R3F56_04315 [Planctomycetota bacterium]